MATLTEMPNRRILMVEDTADGKGKPWKIADAHASWVGRVACEGTAKLRPTESAIWMYQAAADAGDLYPPAFAAAVTFPDLGLAGDERVLLERFLFRYRLAHAAGRLGEVPLTFTKPQQVRCTGWKPHRARRVWANLGSVGAVFEVGRIAGGGLSVPLWMPATVEGCRTPAELFGPAAVGVPAALPPDDDPGVFDAEPVTRSLRIVTSDPVPQDDGDIDLLVRAERLEADHPDMAGPARPVPTLPGEPRPSGGLKVQGLLQAMRAEGMTDDEIRQESSSAARLLAAESERV